MTVNTNVRNVAIILALAAVKDWVPGGGPASNTIIQALSLAFLAAIAWVASRLYREHRTTLYSLGDRRRAIVYGAVGVVILTLSASNRLFHTGPGSLAWLFLLAVSGFAVYRVWRSWREY